MRRSRVHAARHGLILPKGLTDSSIPKELNHRFIPYDRLACQRPMHSAMNACVRGATRCTSHPSIHLCLEVLSLIGHGLFHRSLIHVTTQSCAYNIGPCIAQQLPEGRSWPSSTSTPLKSLMSNFAPSRRRHSPCLRWHHVSKKS